MVEARHRLGSDDRVTLRHQGNAIAELERACRRRGKRQRAERIVSVRIALGQLTAAQYGERRLIGGALAGVVRDYIDVVADHLGC